MQGCRIFNLKQPYRAFWVDYDYDVRLACHENNAGNDRGNDAMTLDLESVEKAQLEEMLPDIGFIDKFLQDLLPQENVHALDLIEDVLKGDWVLNPKLFLDYLLENISSYFVQIKTVFISILVLFILSAVITSFLEALKNESTARMAKLFFILCQLILLIYTFREVLSIVKSTMQAITEFLKLMLPAFMMCIAAAGNGLSAVIFYKLLLGFLCLIEGLLVAALIPVAEGYAMLGILESLFGEKRFQGMMKLMKDGTLWILKGLIMLVTGSGILQLIITPVIDKTNVAILQKTACAIPGIGDIAESVSGITLASATAVKNSFGVLVLLILVLLMVAPAIHIFILLGTVKLASAIGGLCGEQQMVECTDYIMDAGFLLLRMLVTVTALFFLTIAAMTNVT